MELQARNPNYEQRTLDSFDRQGFMHHLGARITEVRPGHVEVAVAFGERLSQQHGYFHGGVVAALADVASGYAAFSLLDPGDSNVTVEFKLNLLAPAEGERLIARGFAIKPGKTLTVCQSNVFCVASAAEKLCATALATFMALPGKAERTPVVRGSA
jgi:uncharacterized protein (TIGR00369 family)